MSQSIHALKRLTRLTGLPLVGASARVLRALGLDAVETALARSSSQVSEIVHHKLERICGISIPPARRRQLYRGLGIEQLEARLLLTTLTWDGGGTTNNWSDAANWNTDTVPAAGDDLVFDGTSLKNAIVDAAFRGTVNSITINSSYSGSISLLTGLNVQRDFSQAGGLFNAGAAALRISQAADISGGTFIASSTVTTFLGDLTISGASFNANSGTVVFQGGDKTVDADGVAFHNVTFNLGSGGDLSVIGTLDVDGNLLIGGSTSSTLKSGTVAVSGNLTTTNVGFRGNGLILLDGAGDQILSANGGAGQVEYLTIQKSGGTLFLQDTIEIYGNLTHVSGNVDAGTGTVEFQGGDKSVDANGIAFHNVTFNLGSGGDLSVVGNLDVNGNLLIKGATNSTLATGTVTVSGNLATTNIGFRGNGLILLDGAGDQILSANGGAGQVENLTIQKSGGTLFLQDTIEIYGNLTHISGNVDAGTGTVEFQGGDKTVDLGGITFHNVTFNLGSGGDLSVVGTLDVNGDLLIKGATNSTLATGTVCVGGNLITTNIGFGGNGYILLDGAGDQILSAAGGAGQIQNLIIQKSGGTLFLQDTIEIYGELTHISGNVDAGSSTVEFQGGDRGVDLGNITFHNVTFNLGSGGDLSVIGTLNVDGNLLIKGATNSTLATGTVSVSGNLTTTNIGFRGNGLILLDGAGDQILSANGGAGQVENLTIQKSGGTLFLQDTIEIYGNLTHVSGNVDAGTGTVEFQGGDRGVDLGNIAFHNVTFNLGSGGDLSVVGTLDVNGNLLIKGASNSTLATGTVTVSGNLTTTNIGFRGAGLIVLDGMGDQILSANGGAGQLENLTIQKSGGTLFLQDTIEIYGNLTHISGNVDAGTSTVEFQGGDKSVDANGVAFHNVTFNLGSGGDLSVIGTLDVDGNLLIKGATNSTLATGTVTVAGDFTNQNSGFRGNGLIELDGSSDQVLTFVSGYRGDLTIAKSGGTAQLATNLVLTGAGNDLRIVSGELDRSGYAVNVGGVVDIAGGTFIGGGTVTGNLSISNGGSVHLNLAGVNQGQYEQLIVTGQLILGGDSHLVLNLSGIAAAGTILDVIHYGSRVGEFTNLSALNVPSSLGVEVQYDSVPGSMDVALSNSTFGGGNSGGGNSGGGNSGGGNSGGGNSRGVGNSQYPLYSWNRFTNIRFPSSGTVVAQTTDDIKYSHVDEAGWKQRQELRPEFEPGQLRGRATKDKDTHGWNSLQQEEWLNELGEHQLRLDESNDRGDTPPREEQFDVNAVSQEGSAGGSNSSETARNLPAEHEITARLDAVDELFAEVAHEGLGDEEVARPAIAAASRIDIDGTALAEAAVLAAAIGSGAAIPALLSNKPGADLCFEKIRRIAVPNHG